MMRGILVPSTSATILDDWNGGGLRSSGSHDFTIENVFVPETHTLPMTGFAVEARHPGTLYRLPFATTLALPISAIPLGLARAAIHALVSLATTKVFSGQTALICELPETQVAVGRAEALLRAARASLFDAVDRYWNVAEAGGTPDLMLRAEVRMAMWNATEVGRQVVSAMCDAAGSSAVDEGGRFPALLRDANAVARHAALSPRILQAAGRVIMGMEPGTVRF